MLGLQLLPQETTTFFKNLTETIQLREEGKIIQMDMMQLLMQAKREYDIQQQNPGQEGWKNVIAT